MQKTPFLAPKYIDDFRESSVVAIVSCIINNTHISDILAKSIIIGQTKSTDVISGRKVGDYCSIMSKINVQMFGFLGTFLM